MEEPQRTSRFRAWWSDLPTDQRFAISLFAVCGGLAFVLSFMHMRSLLHEPFLVSKSVLTQSQKFFANEAANQDSLEASKKLDTDHDGLSDYAEQFVYRTSPYLADTDSDGIMDAIEVAQGTNPTCAKGQPCGATGDALPQTTTSTDLEGLSAINGANQQQMNALNAMFPGTNASTGTQPAASNGTTLLPPGQMTPTELRTYLLQNRLATQEQLNQLTDQQLLDAYVQAYQSAQSGTSDDGSSTP